jgi:hypothetical protein
MANVFQSPLTNQITWKLLLKVFFFGLALFIAIWSSFNPISLALFFLVLFTLYWSETPERRQVRFSFWLASILCLIAVHLLDSPWLFLVALLSLAVFFILFALSHLLFKNQFFFYEILNAVLIFGSTAIYFEKADGDFWGKLIFFAVITALFSEAFDFFGFVAKKRKFLAAAAIGLIALEITWILGFLPLGILNSAAYLTLVLILIRDCLAVYWRGLLSKNFFLRELMFFVILSVIIFAASSWKI